MISGLIDGLFLLGVMLVAGVMFAGVLPPMIDWIDDWVDESFSRMLTVFGVFAPITAFVIMEPVWCIGAMVDIGIGLARVLRS